MLARLASLTIVVTACGQAPSLQAPHTSTAALEQAPAKLRPYLRPRAMTLQLPHEMVKGAGGVASLAERDAVHESASRWTPYFTAGGAPLPVYLERRSITYTGGADNSSQNRSSVVGSGAATVDAYAGSDAQWGQIVSCLQDQFSRFNLTITDVEPTSGEYVEAKFGGTPGQLGLPNGVGGVAPIDSFSCNLIPRAVVYTFSGVLGTSPQVNCEVAAQEIAHAFSLDHEFLCADPMTYLNGCGTKTFQDIAAQCGEFEPRQCNCNRTSHNSVQLMLEKIGSSGPVTPLDPNDTVPPVVTLIAPDNDATFTAGTQSTPALVEIIADVTDTGTVVATDLIWDFNGSIFPCPTSQGAVTCTRTGDRSTWIINVGTGDRTFSVRARDGGGNEIVSAERTIHLTADGTPPPPAPDDDIAPSVTNVTPADGSELLANSTITVSAVATDNQGPPSVELLWTFANEAFPCPMQAQNISCVQTGDTYTWNLTVGVGTRAFQIRATDRAGNAQVTPERTITLTTDPAPPPVAGDDDSAEPNDTAATAFGTRCGTAMDVVATPGNEDWYLIEASLGSDVEVGLVALAGSSLSLSLFRADGTSLLDETQDAVGQTAAARALDDVMLARVTTAGAASISYRLAITCGDGDVPPTPANDDELEPNDDVDAATRSFCGQTRTELAALNDDVYVLTVREGDTLRALVDNPGVTATIMAKDGSELAAAGTDVKAAALPAGDVWVLVAQAADGTSYDLSRECALAPAGVTAGGCTCGTTASSDGALALAALAGALAARRRRHA